MLAVVLDLQAVGHGAKVQYSGNQNDHTADRQQVVDGTGKQRENRSECAKKLTEQQLGGLLAVLLPLLQ